MARSSEISKHVRFAALSFALGTTAAAVQLLPAGEFRAKDGRPEEVPAWRMTEANAQALLSHAVSRENLFVIDYEHQTQLAEKNGQPAPAAGWFKASALKFEPGQGLFVQEVEWTPRASDYIKNKEYRYISAVFGFDKRTGDVLYLVSAALTNDPGLDGMDEVQLAALTARFSKADTTPAATEGGQSTEKSMNPVLKAMLTALGLAETATETEAVSAIASLKGQASQVDGLNTQIASLKSATPDPAKFVSLDKYNELNTQIVQLRSADAARQVDTLISEAKAAGKLVPAVEPVWRDVGKADIAQLKKLIESTPANPALAGQQQSSGKGGEGGGGGGTQLTEAELAVCKSMGLTPEQFKSGAATAAA